MRRIAGLAFLLGTAGLAQQSPPVPPKPPANCTASEFRQFDFWVGAWDVYLTDRPKTPVARSLIEAVYHGCGIRENWTPFSLNDGGSLSGYDPAIGKWRQAWIDASGSRVDFDGGLANDRMVLTGLWRGFGGPGKDAQVRMTYSREAGGAIRQKGESSTDAGKTWAVSFDFLYRPATRPSQKEHHK